MKYCSNCGFDQLVFEIPAGDNRSRFICNNCETIHYQNPRIIVGVLAVHQGTVLLCRRAIEPQKGLWNLPAGFLENKESAAEGAKRETYEEARAAVNISKLHCVYSIPNVNQVYLLFLATMPSAYFEITDESSEVALFNEKDIPWGEIAFSSTTYALKKYFENPNFEGSHVGVYPE